MATEVLMADASTPGAGAGFERVPRRDGTRRLLMVLSYLGLTVGALIVLFPIYMALVGSLVTAVDLGNEPPPFFPTHPQWSNYHAALFNDDLLKFIGNSLIQTTLIWVGAMVTTVLAAYAVAMLRFPGRTLLFIVIIASLGIPFEVTIATNYNTVAQLHMFNDVWGLTVPFMVSAVGIFLLRNAFLSIPKEMQEAAVLDGCGHVRFLWRVAIPLVRPQLAAISVFIILGAWNQYVWPQLLTQTTGANEQLSPLQVGLAHLYGGFNGATIPLAGAIIAIIPVFILLALFNKQLIRSLTAGAVK